MLGQAVGLGTFSADGRATSLPSPGSRYSEQLCDCTVGFVLS